MRLGVVLTVVSDEVNKSSVVTRGLGEETCGGNGRSMQIRNRLALPRNQ